MTDPPRVFVVVAAYNEADSIRPVVESLLGRYPDVVVVDDGSSDGTAERLAGLPARVLHHAINRGQGAALATGIRFALLRGADVVVTFDADGQHDAADVAALVCPVLAGDCDVALGSRFLGRAEAMPRGRRLLLRAASLFTWLTARVRASDVHNGLRAFSRRAASELRITLDRMAHASEIFEEIRRHGWRVREVPVTVRYTGYSLDKGQSSWGALRIALHVLFEKLRQ
jgi:glycosyltransferase involved in cell wall biosynthesis